MKHTKPLLEISRFTPQGVVVSDTSRKGHVLLPSRFYRLTLETFRRDGQLDTVPVLPRMSFRERLAGLWRRG
jgi:hypothetical protein